MDALNELHATRHNLATQIGAASGGVKLKRGVAELDEASKALGASAAPQGQDVIGAVRLLSQHNFDAVRWKQDVENLSVQATYNPSEPLEATDIDRYLAHHHDIIIYTAIEEAKRSAEVDVREMHRR